MTRWMHRAACRDTDPNEFFTISETPTTPAERAQVERAKTVCRGCPVIAECLTWAVETGQHGVWGGMTAPERVEERRRRARRRLAVAS
jgi:WhiB family transcriptional regulator, redox-sensing transcriptional regulator